MSSSVVETAASAQDVEISQNDLKVTLVDGAQVVVPLAWFPRLLHATKSQRHNWKIIGMGEGIHWPDIGEDVSVAGLLRGTRPH